MQAFKHIPMTTEIWKTEHREKIKNNKKQILISYESEPSCIHINQESESLLLSQTQIKSTDLISPCSKLPVESNAIGWQFLFEFQLHLSTCPPSTMLCWVVFAFGAPTRRDTLQKKEEIRQRFLHLRYRCYFMTSEELAKQKSHLLKSKSD